MIITKNLEINSKEEWEEYINTLIKNAQKKGKIDKNIAIKELMDAILEGFNETLPERFLLFFSGGIDSTTISLVAKKLNRHFLCLSGGFRDSHDIKIARESAKSLELNNEIVYFEDYNLTEEIKEVKKIINKSDVVNIEIGLVFYLLLKGSNKEKAFNFVVTGLGSEELFIGYHKYVTASDPEKESIEWLKNLYEKDIMRDKAVINAFSKEAIFPFFHPKVIETALRIPLELKLREGYKKYCLREVARRLGLDKRLAFEHKKAAQYGSRIDKEIRRLSKKAGFKKRGDFIRSLLKAN